MASVSPKQLRGMTNETKRAFGLDTVVPRSPAGTDAQQQRSGAKTIKLSGKHGVWPIHDGDFIGLALSSSELAIKATSRSNINEKHKHIKISL
jgi:hypothetical protein